MTMICKKCKIEKDEKEYLKECKNGNILKLLKCENCREKKKIKIKSNIIDNKKRCQRCNVYKEMFEYEKILNKGEIKLMSKCIECRKICKKLKIINKN